ncbi:MAG: hypothetical protein JW724_01810 [Candidatus Altiarchaeota archaeon]|nr:hypothetical protein [Candidatus Altiarchaeota archaeon]
MIDLIARSLQEASKGFMDQTSQMIRREVNYVSDTLRSSIEYGIKEGFDSVRKAMFYLFIALAATMVSMIFMTWGLAQIFQSIFKQEGLGFLVFGIVLFIFGMISFSMSKPK